MILRIQNSNFSVGEIKGIIISYIKLCSFSILKLLNTFESGEHVSLILDLFTATPLEMIKINTT